MPFPSPFAAARLISSSLFLEEDYAYSLFESFLLAGLRSYGTIPDGSVRRFGRKHRITVSPGPLISRTGGNITAHAWLVATPRAS